MEFDYMLIFFFVAIISAQKPNAHQPQVYEEVDEEPLVLNSIDSKKSTNPPWFSNSISNGTQRDQLKWRYYQQQQFDLQNHLNKNPLTKILYALQILKSRNVPKKEKLRLIHDVAEKGRKMKSQKVLKRVSRTIKSNEKITETNVAQDKKLSNETFLDIQQKISAENTEDFNKIQEKHMKTFDTLMAKDPKDQLEELQKLLDDHSKFLSNSQPQKRYVSNNRFSPLNPIVVLPLEHENQQVYDKQTFTPDEHLHQLQSQLDVFAKSQANDQLKKAQEEALQNVRAQHAAFEIAQREALEKMRQIRNGIGINLINKEEQSSIVERVEIPKRDETLLNMDDTFNRVKNNVRKATSLAAEALKAEIVSDKDNFRTFNNIPARIESQQTNDFSHRENNRPGIVYASSNIQIQKQEDHLPNPNHLGEKYGNDIPTGNAYVSEENSQTRDSYLPNGNDANYPYHHHTDNTVNKFVPNSLSSLLYPDVHPIQINEAYLSTPSPIKENKLEESVASETKDYDENGDYASNYAFGYQVQDYESENNFGHEETNNGESAKGYYHVKLPDGRTQHVEYTADESGFHAKVTYSDKS